MSELIRKAVYYTGLYHLWRYLNRERITILMLHGVSDGNGDGRWRPLWPRMTARRFDETLAWFRRFYTFLSVEDAIDIVAGKRPPVRHGLVITFDDGYRNNFREAWPILQKHGAPASFYIATGYVETGRSFWIDRLDYALQAAPDSARLLTSGSFSFDLRGLDRDGLADAYRRLRLAVKQQTSSDEEMLSVFDQFSTQLESAAGSTISDILDDDAYVSVATWKEMRAAAADGATIGSHSVDHARMDKIDRQQVAPQLCDSRSMIEDRIGKQCDVFCYPNGGVDDFVASAVETAGYRGALSTAQGLNSAGDSVYRLKRFSFPTRGTPLATLIGISGLQCVPVLRRFFR